MLAELFTAFVFLLDVIAITKVLAGEGSTTRKVLWILGILFVPVVGAVLWFLVGESRDHTRLLADPRRLGHGSR